MTKESKEQELSKEEDDLREIATVLAEEWEVTTGEALRIIDAIEGTNVQNIEKALKGNYEKDKEVNMEEITKADLPDEIKEQVDELFKQNEEIRKENEQIRKQLIKEKEEKRLKQFISKAEQFENLAVEPTDFGKILKKVADVDSDGFDKLMEVLKSADENLKQNKLFKEEGSSYSDTGADAWSKIEKSAQSLLEADTSLSRERAINKVLENNPELYNQYLKEKEAE